MVKKIVLGVLGAFILIVLMVSCMGGGSKEEKVDNSSQPQVVSYEDVDGVALIKEAQENAAAANHKYKGKNVKIINAQVSNIDSDGDHINLNTSNSKMSLMSISCSIDKKNKNLQEQVFAVKNGQKVIVYGSIQEIGDTLGVRMKLDKIEPAQ